MSISPYRSPRTPSTIYTIVPLLSVLIAICFLPSKLSINMLQTKRWGSCSLLGEIVTTLKMGLTLGVKCPNAC